MTSATKDLLALQGGDGDANRRLFDLLYNDFHRLATSYLRREKNADQLTPASLVSEAFIRMVDQSQVDAVSRTHFFAIGAKVMRRLLVDHARHRKAKKRGGGWHQVELDESITFDMRQDHQVLRLDELLAQLEILDERQAKVVEMKFFGSMAMKEIAEVLEVSLRTVEKDWAMARAWLRKGISEGEDS